MLRRLTALYLYLGSISVVFGLVLFSTLIWLVAMNSLPDPFHPRLLAAGGLAQALLIAGAWLAARLLWRQADKVRRAPPADIEPADIEQDALPVIAVLLRTLGDFGALSVLSVSAALGLLVAIAGDQLAQATPQLAPFLAKDPPIVRHLTAVGFGGVLAATGATLAAIIALPFRAGSEAILLRLSVAADTRSIRESLQR